MSILRSSPGDRQITQKMISSFFKHGRTVKTPDGLAWFTRTGTNLAMAWVSLKHGGIRAYPYKRLIELNRTQVLESNEEEG